MLPPSAVRPCRGCALGYMTLRTRLLDHLIPEMPDQLTGRTITQLPLASMHRETATPQTATGHRTMLHSAGGFK